MVRAGPDVTPTLARLRNGTAEPADVPWSAWRRRTPAGPARVSSPRPRAPGVPKRADDHGDQRCHRAAAPPAAPRVRAGQRLVSGWSVRQAPSLPGLRAPKPPPRADRRGSFHAAARSGRRHTTAARPRPVRVPRGTPHARHPPPAPGTADVLHARTDLDDTHSHAAQLPQTLQGAHREEWRGQATASGDQGVARRTARRRGTGAQDRERRTFVSPPRGRQMTSTVSLLRL